MLRWAVVLVLAIPILVIGGGMAERIGVSPSLVLVPLGVVLAWALAPAILRSVRIPDRDGVEAFKDDLRDRPAPRRASSRDPALRPVSRLSGTDPLDPIFGAQASFPADPDLGRENAHHLVIDPHDLGEHGDPGADRVGSGREDT